MTNKKKTPSLADWDRQYLWHPFTQMQEWEQEEPLIIERGKGPYLIDTEGRTYLDGTASIWVNVHGHRHPTLDRALDGLPLELGQAFHPRRHGSTLLNRHCGRARIRERERRDGEPSPRDPDSSWR